MKPHGKSREKILFGTIEVILLVVCVFILLPFIFALLNSFKSPAEAANLNFALPQEWKFENYLTVLKEAKIINGFLNSCLITIVSVVITLAFASLASFVLGRKNTRGNRIIYTVFVAGLIPPPFAITTIKVMQVLGLSGQYSGLILFYCAIYMPFTVFLISGFIKTIPKQLDEAAMIDGCGPIRFFFSIILPLLKPVIATASIFCFMFIWNDFTWPLYMLNDSSKWTIPLTVYNFISKYNTQWQLVFVDLIIAALPVLLLYFSAQRYIVDGMTAGAVKE